MDIYNLVKQSADAFIIENNIKRLNFTVDQIILLIEKYGYIVFTYKNGMAIIQHLKKQSETYRLGFTYKDENNTEETYVFYDDKYSIEIQIDVLMHELAHIYLGHPNKPDKYKSQKEKDFEEDTANAFKLNVFAPLCVLKGYNIKSPSEIENLTCVLPDQIKFVWEKYCNYKISNEDELVIKQYTEALKYRQLLKKWNETLHWSILTTAWITTGIMILVYLIFLW